jgi:hypothetical protein
MLALGAEVVPVPADSSGEAPSTMFPFAPAKIAAELLDVFSIPGPSTTDLATALESCFSKEAVDASKPDIAKAYPSSANDIVPSKLLSAATATAEASFSENPLVMAMLLKLS